MANFNSVRSGKMEKRFPDTSQTVPNDRGTRLSNSLRSDLKRPTAESEQMEKEINEFKPPLKENKLSGYLERF
ncbi:unnamed protein product [Gongylonema pulchrum]|uniref:StbA n=1 Tax=Gongylonema pulchrum TaxID=637853 RepID=A0A183D7V9_9BILA|nr:unnamed protein product [Gongylonema pulchrum]